MTQREEVRYIVPYKTEDEKRAARSGYATKAEERAQHPDKVGTGAASLQSKTGAPSLSGTPVLYFCEVRLKPVGSELRPIRPEAAIH